MSYSLNSLKGVILGIPIGAMKGDTRSLDYSSYWDDGKENGSYYLGFQGLGFTV